MPIYDLVCECGYSEMDVQLSVSDYTRATCPKCGKKISHRPTGLYWRGVGEGWTPRMTGEDRWRPRSEVLGEALHTWKKHDRNKKIENERRESSRPIYIT